MEFKVLRKEGRGGLRDQFTSVFLFCDWLARTIQI